MLQRTSCTVQAGAGRSINVGACRVQDYTGAGNLPGGPRSTAFRGYQVVLSVTFQTVTARVVHMSERPRAKPCFGIAKNGPSDVGTEAPKQNRRNIHPWQPKPSSCARVGGAT